MTTLDSRGSKDCHLPSLSGLCGKNMYAQLRWGRPNLLSFVRPCVFVRPLEIRLALLIRDSYLYAYRISSDDQDCPLSRCLEST